uniref:Zinc-finger protein n=1 Tax=Mesembryanthemum crystallinum TaxID=3544 RepID=A0A109R6M0_MESCR|nr:zinc-finger protein [Mesembryanthemum crystallinum]
MGHETVDGFQETEKQNSGCATNEENAMNSCKVNSASVSETVIIGIPKELPNLNNSCATISADSAVATDSENRLNNSGENAKVRDAENEGKSWVVDVKCRDEEEERVCRICHLSSEQGMKPSMGWKTELIRLGCSCNGELSLAHSYCAEAWFKLKGNRVCEICGEMVSNIRGIGDEMFMEEWIESGLNGNELNSSERHGDGCWHGQPFCNFLMACLVIAFVVPWFFHINMF